MLTIYVECYNHKYQLNIYFSKNNYFLKTNIGSYLYPAPIILDRVNSIVSSCLNPNSFAIFIVSSSMNLYFGVFAILYNNQSNMTNPIVF